jgi:hypothetical protein
MSSTLASRALTFFPTTHEYWLDGRRVPSVTEILKATGVSTIFDELGAMTERIRGAIEFKRDLGSALHADIHSFDDGDLAWETVDERVLPYLEAWTIFRENTGLRPLARERVVFDPTLNVCGTLDGIFESPSGGNVLIDVKVGDPKSAACHLQTGGYYLLWLAEHSAEVMIHERWAVQLMPQRKIPYNVTPYTDWNDLAKFRACVTVYYEQDCRRSK